MLERGAPSRGEALAIGVLAAALGVVLLARWWVWRAPAPPITAAGAPAPGITLDVNAAAWWELDTLPGVGETLARRIVADRERHGPFPNLEALARVPGISAAAVSRWRPFLTIPVHGGPTRE